MRNILFIILLLVFAMKSYAQDERADPTRPTTPAEVSDTGEMDSHGLRLSGIFSKADNYAVVINGKILHKGDTINGYTIVTTSKNSVTLKSNTNESLELKFSDFNFKQPHH
ncbi:MAG TPA: hypothetical protein VGV92_07900 [Gammaproteobacteria bacterium]|nr:hypothetical protein [Gammaproteobacteria bacterium]